MVQHETDSFAHDRGSALGRRSGAARDTEIPLGAARECGAMNVSGCAGLPVTGASRNTDFTKPIQLWVESRREVWFWVTMALFASAHIAAILLLSFRLPRAPALSYVVPAMFADGFAMFVILNVLASRYLSGVGLLTTVFAGLIFVVAGYMLWKSGRSIGR